MSDAAPVGRDLARRLVGGGVAVCALAAAVGTSPSVGAFGSLSDGSHVPLEQRVAIAVGAQRTVVWSQLRVDAGTGPFAVIVPAAPGAALDWSSDAWMEALEEATAPAILPPDGVDAVCPGEPEDPDRVHLVGRSHGPTVTPLEVIELPDAMALATWAGQHGMVASAALYATLEQSGGPFVAARFSGTGAATLTPTLRIVRPSADTSLPFVLTEATSQPVDVALFTLATARPQLDGSPAWVSPQEIVFDVAAGTSNYETRRAAALDAPDRWLLECSSHPRLDEPLDLTPSTSLASLLGGYFIRGTAYEPVGTSANDCFALASGAMQGPVGTACPAAAIGVVGGGADDCLETSGNAPPSAMRCGLDQDSPLGDLALAFSGQLPQAMVLSRVAMRLGAGEVGASPVLSFVAPSTVSPVREAAAVDFDGCPGGGSSSSSTSGGGSSVSSGGGAGGPGTTEGTGGTRRVPVYERTDSCGSRADVGVPVFYTDVDDTEDAPDAYYTEGADDCGGDTTSSYDAVYDTDGDGVHDDVDRYDGYDGDDCGGDTYDDDTYESESDYEGDDCGGDSYDDSEWASDHEDDCGGDASDGYEWEDDDCSGDASDGYDSSDDDCGGDASDGYEWEDDDCGGDSSDGYDSSDCDSGDSDSESCTISRGSRRRPRLSAITLSMVALLFPLRRWRRPRRRKRRVKRG